MKKPRRSLENRKGINTILASLLMVVIVVVAAVMVYAWSTGLLGTLLVTPNVKEGPLSVDSSAFTSGTNVTLYIRNAGTSNVALNAYYVSDSSGNTWQYLSWNGPTIVPNKSNATNILIGTGCTPNCTQSSGTTGSFPTFQTGYSYTIKVITTKNNPFSFTVTK